MNQHNVPFVTFNDGTEYPQLGLGTWKLRDDEAVTAVRTAIELGYRHFDTATLYQNEEAVGRALNDAMQAGDVTRDELFITTKIWHTDQGAETTAEAFQKSLENLKLDYLDLYLIHWPWPSAGKYVETFDIMARMQGMGSVQSLGVANFYPEALDELIEKSGITPVLNQVELHPRWSQQELQNFHRSRNIVTSAWSPLGQGSLLDNPEIEKITAEVGKTAAQVILRWHIQQGIVVIPKAGSKKKLEQNIDIFDFELTDEQMSTITGMDTTAEEGRIGPSPLEFPEPEEG